MTKSQIEQIVTRISFNILDTPFIISVETDKKDSNGRNYLQVTYYASCNKADTLKKWTGRKFYLSEHCIPDEIVKTCYLACKLAVEHEIMEGFTVDDKILFNPHVNFEELLKVTTKEVQRN